MKTYYVSIPCTMTVCVTVDAETEEEAKQKAFGVDFDVNVTGDNDACLQDFEAHEQIVKGSVFYGVQNEVDVTENN